MDVTTRGAPTPGTAAPGNLYADLQSRTLWLGVDASVDPTQSVLVSDIVALQTDINDARADATAYTDTQILTRAPTVHTHVATDISDFNSAVTAIVLATPAIAYVRGMIMLWSGLLTDIGVGALAGWALCDGANGTPDLRDRFIVGAGNKVPGTKNPQSVATTNNAGNHAHGVHYTAITEAQMPYHAHWASVSGSGSGSGGTDAQGYHAHEGAAVGPTKIQGGNYGSYGAVQGATAAAGSHAHNVSVNVNVSASGATDYRGGSQGHTHSMDYAPDHSHTIASADLREATPYYALAYIMKL
jgi:hypothetical protein